MTDKWVGYKHLNKEFTHVAVDHAAGEYVVGIAHTNTIEGYWSHMKRQIFGVHHWVSGNTFRAMSQKAHGATIVGRWTKEIA